MLGRFINNYIYKALNRKEEAKVKIAKLKEHLDNRTNELCKAN